MSSIPRRKAWSGRSTRRRTHRQSYRPDSFQVSVAAGRALLRVPPVRPAGQHAGFEQDLEAVADAEDELVRVQEPPERVAERAGQVPGEDHAGPEVVAVAEPAGDAEDLVAVERVRLLQHAEQVLAVADGPGGGEGAGGLLVAVGARGADDQDAGRGQGGGRKGEGGRTCSVTVRDDVHPGHARREPSRRCCSRRGRWRRAGATRGRSGARRPACRRCRSRGRARSGSTPFADDDLGPETHTRPPDYLNGRPATRRQFPTGPARPPAGQGPLNPFPGLGGLVPGRGAVRGRIRRVSRGTTTLDRPSLTRRL